MSEKSEAFATLESKYAEFRERITTLPGEAFDELSLGDWSLAQLLGHMAGWFGEMTVSAGRVANGERPTPEGVDYSDENAWNAKFADSAPRGASALDAFDAAYAKYCDAVAALPEEKFASDAQSGKPGIGVRLLSGTGIHHFEEHGPQIEDWLSKRTPA